MRKERDEREEREEREESKSVGGGVVYIKEREVS